MKPVLFAGVMLALAAMHGAAFAQGAWCADEMDGRNCGFYTLEQCRAAVSGHGGICYANQVAARPPAPAPVKRSKRVKQAQ